MSLIFEHQISNYFENIELLQKFSAPKYQYFLKVRNFYEKSKKGQNISIEQWFLNFLAKVQFKIRYKIQSPKNVKYREKCPENLPKYLHIIFHIWFPKSKWNPKYIKIVLVHSLRTPALKHWFTAEIFFLDLHVILLQNVKW